MIHSLSDAGLLSCLSDITDSQEWSKPCPSCELTGLLHVHRARYYKVLRQEVNSRILVVKVTCLNCIKPLNY